MTADEQTPLPALTHPLQREEPELFGNSPDGVVVAISDLGGAGPVALCSHGAGLHGQMFQPLASELADVLHCYGVDLRGHGLSSPAPEMDYSWYRFADDVLAAVQAVGGPPLFGIGHSAGAAALLLAEARSPGTFRSIFCYEPIIRTPAARRDLPHNPHLLEATRQRRASFGSKEEAFARYSTRPPFAVTADKGLWAYVDYGFDELDDGTVQLRCLPEHEAQIYAQGIDAYTFEVLGEVACPVTIAYGTASENLGRRTADDSVAALPDGRLVAIEGLDHLGPMENPAAVAAAVRDWLRELAARG